MNTHRTPALGPSLALICLVAAAPLHAQTDPGPWVPLDPSPPGTAAEVVFDPISSSAVDSFFDVFIHGFYSPTRIGPDGLPYREVNVPGLGSIGQTGAPALPAVAITLAIPTDAAEVTISQYLPGPIVTLPGFLPWPQPIPASDSGSTAEIFVRDPTIYSGPVPQYPPNPGDPGPVINMLPGITGAILKVHPAFWKPGTGELQIAAHIRLTLHHPGNVALRPPAPRTRVWQAQSLCMNWQSTMQFFPIDEESLKGEYLFVRPISYGFAILPLWYQKQDRGFRCSNVFTDIVGSSCTAIRTAIQSWYALHPNKEHYVLLIGDTETIPLCTSPFVAGQAYATDDLYGSVSGDFHKKVHVGRLSVSSVAECSQQIARIVAYEDTPPAGQNFSDVVLISHRETSPRNFTKCQEAVRTASYALTPNFTTIYGTDAASTNASITNAVNQGPGLVCYRGHGEWYKWKDWDQSAQNYFNWDVAGLNNQPRNPVVWSIACHTADISHSDCFGESWMHLNKHGAVSFYGATYESSNPENDIIDKALFKAVYDHDAPDQAWAIEQAEFEDFMRTKDAVNPWMYLLLGDPQMRIRRENVGSGPAQLTSGKTAATALLSSLKVIPPPPPHVGCEDFKCCPTCPGGTLDFRVLGPGRVPVPGIKVAVWKGIPPALDATSSDEVSELLDNRYTDADGWARIPTPPLSVGMIHYTATDDREFSMVDSLAVEGTTGVAETGEHAELRIAAVPSVMRGATRFEFSRPLAAAGEVQVFGVDGRRVRTILVGAGDRAVVWSGDTGDGGRAASGLYFVRLHGERGAEARVIVLN